MTTMNRKTDNKKNLLVARKPVVPPTETTRMLEAMLDGKKRPKKRSGTRATDREQHLSSNDIPHGRPKAAMKSIAKHPTNKASFGEKKGLAQLPKLSKNGLKRKRNETVSFHRDVAIKSKTLKFGRRESRHKLKTDRNGKENPANNTALVKGRPRMKANPYKRQKSEEKQGATVDPDNKGIGTKDMLYEENDKIAPERVRALSKHKAEGKKPTCSVVKTSTTDLDYGIAEKARKYERHSEAKARARGTEQIMVTSQKAQSDSGKGSDGQNHAQDQSGNSETKQHVLPVRSQPALGTSNSPFGSTATMNREPPWEAAEHTIQLGLTLKTRPAGDRRRRGRSSLSANPPHSTEGLGGVVSVILSTATAAMPSKPMAGVDPLASTAGIKSVVDAAQPARLLAPMRPIFAADKMGRVGPENPTNRTSRPTPSKQAHNDNFVRLNLRNSAGSCRGARNKKTNNRKFDRPKRSFPNVNDDDGSSFPQDRRPLGRKGVQKHENVRAGVDPLDDYLDGVLQSSKTEKSLDGDGGPSALGNEQNEGPKCTRHQRPCKQLTVKKTGTGNKGRKFYCCSMPRGEQCDHFQWADDTVQAARIALLKNTSHSGFMARQVAAHSERFKKLTVPELREAAKGRGLDTKGKKQQLLMRLSLWVRDELAAVGPKETDAGTVPENHATDNNIVGGADYSNDEPLDVSNLDDGDEASGESDGSLSDEELELFRCENDKVIGDQLHVHKALGTDVENKKQIPASERVGNEEEDSSSAIIREALKRLFGYDNLREGQEWAIKRCLTKQYSLLVSPTGSGKSLCYQLPAALMTGVCIVVSPLISLIQDQLRELPPRIPAATLSGSQTSAATAAIVDDVIRQRIKILFVSPERLASASFQRLFQVKWNKEGQSMERPFPPVSLLCVDEAHCLSQWAHNFRPSYLRLRSLINKVEPQSVLALTATAGPKVVQDICSALGIEQCRDADAAASCSCRSMDCQCGVWTMKTDRENIDVKSFLVTTQEKRLSMLVELLKPRKAIGGTKKKTPGFIDGCLSTGSIIVYVWRQRDAEVVAESIQASGVPGGVVHYHGGMDSGSRSNAYSKFMRGKARICVATVAFGMGVNKIDVEGVVHMYLPASPEHYLQEIGRAGRDGRPAKAIALVLEEEALVRHSQAYSDKLSNSQVRSVVLSCQKKVKQIIESMAVGHWTDVPAIGVALPLHEITADSDCKSETIETIFSLLELREKTSTPSIQVEGVANDQVTISLKRRKLEKLVEYESIAKAIQNCATCVDAPVGEARPSAETANDPYGSSQRAENTRHQQFVAYSFGSYQFSVSTCANLLGPAAQPRHVFAALRRLQSKGEIELSFDKTSSAAALRIIMNKSGLELFLGGDNTVNCFESLVSDLAEEMNTIATVSASKVLDMHHIINKVSRIVQPDTSNEEDHDEDEDRPEISKSLALFQDLCHQYFKCPSTSSLSSDSEETLPPFAKEIPEKEILIDSLSLIADLTQSNHRQGGEFALDLHNQEAIDYTALAVTRFFHGMPSVRVPMNICRHNRLFGKWQAIRFNELLDAVHRVLSQYK